MRTLIAGLLALLASVAVAQTFPERSVRIIVPLPPGGSPDTIAEAGVPGYSLDPWLGLFVPGKVPPEIVGRIHAEVTKVANAPELKARLLAAGIIISTHSPADFSRLIRGEHLQWGKLIREADIRGE